MLRLRVARKVREETWVQGLGGKTLREETTWKIWA